MALFAHGQSNPDDPIENILHLAILRFGVHDLQVSVQRGTTGADTVLVDQNGREFRMQGLISQALAATPNTDQFYQAIMSHVDAAAKGIDAPPPSIANVPPPVQPTWDMTIPSVDVPSLPAPSFPAPSFPAPGAPALPSPLTGPLATNPLAVAPFTAAPSPAPSFPAPGSPVPNSPVPSLPMLNGQPGWEVPAPVYPPPAMSPPVPQPMASMPASADPILQQVRLRLVPESFRQLVNVEYGQPAAAGLLAVLCLDHPNDVTYLTDEQLVGRDVTALFQAGFSNTMAEKIDVLEEPAPGVQAIMGDSLFTASKAIGMGQLVGRVLPAAPHGVVFGVPHRHLLYVHVVTGPNLIHAVNALATLIVSNATDGVPGGVLSNLTYYWRDDIIEPVGFPDADGKVQIVATGRFGKMLNEVLR